MIRNGTISGFAEGAHLFRSAATLNKVDLVRNRTAVYATSVANGDSSVRIVGGTTGYVNSAPRG